MSETKHTPGPWMVGITTMVHPGGNTSRLEVFNKENTPMRVGEWEGGIPPEHEANAHLIAAAPELLAVVEEFVKDIDAVGHAKVMEEWPDVADTYGRAIAALERVERTD